MDTHTDHGQMYSLLNVNKIHGRPTGSHAYSSQSPFKGLIQFFMAMQSLFTNHLAYHQTQDNRPVPV